MLSTVECFLHTPAWLQFSSEFDSMKSVRRLLRIAVTSLPIQLKKCYWAVIFGRINVTFSFVNWNYRTNLPRFWYYTTIKH